MRVKKVQIVIAAQRERQRCATTSGMRNSK
jgi:hypothetical protein